MTEQPKSPLETLTEAARARIKETLGEGTADVRKKANDFLASLQAGQPVVPPFTIVPVGEGSPQQGASWEVTFCQHSPAIHSFLQEWTQAIAKANEAEKQRAQQVRIRADQIAHWTREEWEGEFVRLVTALQAALAGEDQARIDAATDEFNFFQDLARLAGHVVEVDNWNPQAPTDVTLNFAFSGPLGEYTLEERHERVKRALDDQLGQAGRHLLAVGADHDELDRIIKNYGLQGNLSRWKLAD